jgi:Domain of unknown function (DUF4232)
MSESPEGRVDQAFADLRSHATIVPTGMAAVRARAARRRRARTVLAAAAAAAVVLAAPAVYSLVPRTIAPTPPAATTTPAPSGAAADTPCRSGQLTGTVTDGGAIASQPWAIIALTNVAETPCVLAGYPRIEVRGRVGYDPEPDGLLPVTVENGPIYVRQDPGPTTVTLNAGEAASFAISTNTADDGGARIYTMTTVDIMVAPADASVTVPVNLQAAMGSSDRIGVTVTAFVSGRDGPPS